MPNRHRYERGLPRGDPIHSWLGILIVSVLAFGAVGILPVGWLGPRWHEADMRKWMSWPTVAGTPVATRIVEQPLTKTSFRGLRSKWYVGECRVAYSVVGAQYSLWTEAVRGVDVNQLTADMRNCPNRSYTVHYDPSDPSIAHAFVANAARP